MGVVDGIGCELGIGFFFFSTREMELHKKKKIGVPVCDLTSWMANGE